MKDFNTTGIGKEEWLTPPELVHSLGGFTLDPCACEDHPWVTADEHWYEAYDGLAHDWKGRVWLNPPYGRETFKWIEKLADHKSGIALIFARTETKGFHKEIWNKAHSVFFFKGRINFYERFWSLEQYDNEWWSSSQILKAIKDNKDFIVKENAPMIWDNPAPANAPSCLVSYSEFDTRMIQQAVTLKMIKGKLIC